MKLIEINEFIQIGYSFICLYDSDREVEGDGEWDELCSKTDHELLIIASPFDENKIRIFIDEEIYKEDVSLYFNGEHEINTPSNNLIIQWGWEIDEQPPSQLKIRCAKKVRVKFYVKDLEDPSSIFISITTGL